MSSMNDASWRRAAAKILPKLGPKRADTALGKVPGRSCGSAVISVAVA
jgi:hypothetical protein